MHRNLQYLAIAALAAVGASAQTDCSKLGNYAGITTEEFAGMIPPCTVSTIKPSNGNAFSC